MIGVGKRGPDGLPKADPAIYPKLRERALRFRVPDMADGAVHAVLMDWRVSNGMATIYACADGTASLYLSSGGGFIGGGQKYPAIREAALTAISVARKLIDQFEATESTDFPLPGDVQFFVVTNAGFRRGAAAEALLQQGIDPLLALANAMQMVVTQYRLQFQGKKSQAVQ
jgi:rhodanese-related sulfurtransferase